MRRMMRAAAGKVILMPDRGYRRMDGAEVIDLDDAYYAGLARDGDIVPDGDGEAAAPVAAGSGRRGKVSKG